MNLSAFASAALLLVPPSSLELVTNGQGFSTLHVANLLQPILDVLKKVTLGRVNPDEPANVIFNKRTGGGADMGHYQALLSKAVAAITGKAEEKGVESLFERGGTVISKESFRGIDDFEVITYLVIVDEGQVA